MDISETIVPNSDQVNAEDLIGGPQTVTVTGVEKGTKDQPVFIHLAEFAGRTFRPGKSMRRVLVAAWGAEASEYTGRRLTLYNDPTIRFGKDVTGGIRISHASHIDKALTVNLTVTRGRRAPFTIQPLPDAPAPVDNVAEWITALNTAQSIGDLQSAWEKAAAAGVTNRPDVIAAKDARKKELSP